jgi:hypothetical protein
MGNEACRRLARPLKQRHRPTPRTRRLTVLVRFVFAFVCHGTCASAVGPDALAARLAALQVPGVSWQAQHYIDMSGVPIHVRPFFSTLDATRLARSLASQTGQFQRLITLADTLLLSGLHADAHWLAKIDVSDAGASGYVSVLAVDATPPARGGQALDVQAWLPANAAALYRHRSASNGRTLEQYFYSVTDTPPVSMAYVRQQLRRQGWRHDPSFAGIGGGEAWSRKGSRLTVLASAQPRGSALYIQHLE